MCVRHRRSSITWSSVKGSTQVWHQPRYSPPREAADLPEVAATSCQAVGHPRRVQALPSPTTTQGFRVYRFKYPGCTATDLSQGYILLVPVQALRLGDRDQQPFLALDQPAWSTGE